MVREILFYIVGQAPWAILIIIVIYSIYRELKHDIEILKKSYEELKESDIKELKESDEKLRNKFKEENERLRNEFKEELRITKQEIKLDIKELKESDERLRNEFKEENKKLRNEFKEENERLRNEIKDSFKRFSEALFSVQEAILSLLYQKGYLKKEEVDNLKVTILNFLKIASSRANPISKEEINRALQIVSKDIDEVTREEALELYNLSFKIMDEFYDKPEAYSVFHYAIALKYFTSKKEK